MFPPKLNHWLSSAKLPQRLLLSGSGDLKDIACSIASQQLNEDLETIKAGLNPDVKVCVDTQETLKIGDTQNPDDLSVRGLIKWLYQTPVASQRILILEHLERTSRDAMQAWLKVLEEPPARAQFILTTRNHYQLPTTILSRVTVLPIASQSHNAAPNGDAEMFLTTKDLITKFKLVEALDKAQKEDPKAVLNFMDELMALARSQATHQNWLPQLFQTYSDVKRNVNRKLALEHLAIKLQNH